MANTTRKQVTQKIASLGKRTAKLNEAIQVTMIDICEHVYEFGDVSLADSILGKMKGADRKAMAAWFVAYAGVVFAQGKPTKLNKQHHRSSEFDREYLTDTASPWFEMGDSLDKILTDLDVSKKIAAIVKGISKAKSEGRHVIAEKEAIAMELRNLVSALEAPTALALVA